MIDHFNAFATFCLIAGALVFLYHYHVWTRQFDAAGRTQVTSFRWYELIDWYLKISSLAITIASLHWHHRWLWQIHNSIGLRLFGLLLAGAAMILFVWAMRTLQSQFTPAHLSRLPLHLVSSGPYRWIRHPIYSSNLMLMIGLLLTGGSLWLLVNLAVLVVYYVPTIRREEAAIAQEFPEYGEYMKRTGRFFPINLLGQTSIKEH